MALIYPGSCTEFNQLSSMTNSKANLNWMFISSKINNKFHLKSTINSLYNERYQQQLILRRHRGNFRSPQIHFSALLLSRC